MFRASLCPSSGDRLYKTACGVSLDVLAAVVWSRDRSWAHSAVRSVRVPTPHNRSQHIQANTTRGFIESVFLTMGIVMPETCWVNLLLINIYTFVICRFFLLLKGCHMKYLFTGNITLCREQHVASELWVEESYIDLKYSVV